MTEIGDVVLVHYEKDPAFFARIEDIYADVKPGWFSVRMQVLAVPLSEITWILREEYINGGEFTMGGKPVRLEKVERLAPLKEPEPEKPAKAGGQKVVALSSRKKPDAGG
ncbi:MAG: hypothetical protein AB1921_17265 [Thermodesulfobacteriota bacterium]